MIKCPPQAVYLIDGARTPFGHNLRQGSYSQAYTKLDLGLMTAQSLLLKQAFSVSQLDDVVIASSTLNKNIDLGQQLSQRLQCKPSLVSHTFSASENCAIQALQYAHQQIAFNQKSLILLAGIEASIVKPIALNSSLSQWIREWQRAKGLKEKLKTLNNLHTQYFHFSASIKKEENHDYLHQEIAEKTASYFSLSAGAMAEYVTLSQRRLKYAQRNKLLKNIIPIFYPDGSSLYRDEDIINTDPESLRKTIITGNPPTGIISKASITRATDGVCILLLANQQMLEKYNLSPLAKLSEPSLVNEDNVIEILLGSNNLKTSEIDYWEWDEISAAEVLSLEKKPHFESIEAFQSLSHVNVDGGSLTLGNPNSANKFRCILQLASILQRNKANNGICHFSFSNAQSSALLLQRTKEAAK